MSLAKITLAGLFVVGLCLPTAAQTRSAVVYPEDGNDPSAEQSPSDLRVPAYRTASRADENAASRLSYDQPPRRLRRASYNGPYGERVAPAPSPESGPIPHESLGETAEIVHDPVTMQYEPLSSGGPLAGSAGDAGPCEGCCCECGGEYCSDCNRPLFGFLCDWGHRNLAVFGGVNGFKGPRDRGVNGNFGFQEGLNYGAPLGDPWGCGFQLGFQAVETDISGSQTNGAPTADRHQYFATAGIFRRAEVGKIQWAVAFDFLHDTYSDTADLKQIRSETGWLFNEQTEVGYAGAYGIGGDNTTVTTHQTLLVSRLDPTDQFVVYIRRYFDNGGDGRLFGGITGKGDGLFGGDVWIPLGGSWALQNDFVYLIPKNGRGVTTDSSGMAVDGGQVRETWGVALNLVWYPGRAARCVGESCYRPVLNVADNSQFLVNANISQ